MADMLNAASLLLARLDNEVGLQTHYFWGVEIRKLQTTLRRLYLLVGKRPDALQALPLFLRDLNDVLVEACDLLDEIANEKSGWERIKRGSIGGKVMRYCSSSNPLVFHCMIAFKFRAINRKLSVLLDNRPVSCTDDPHMGRLDRETHSFEDPSEVIGRVEDKEKIIEILTQPTEGEDINVLAIVGIGGIGKTTLAQLVFNDERVEMLFELRLWACVADRVDLRELVRSILMSLWSEACEEYTMDIFTHKLSECVAGKKYLLVLDDVCYIDPPRWLYLERLLKMGGNGSRIIVTTRFYDIAGFMGTVPPFELEGLSFKDSWSLFLRLVESEVPYEEIMKEIVTCCGGVPLAVRQTAAMLFCGTIKDLNTERDWKIWKIPEFQDRVLSVLKLSYDRMSLGSKQCFKHCSFFPKDYELNSFELIQFWETFGLISPKDDSRAIGMKYLDELCSSSLLKECKGETAFSLKYKMPPLIHDMAHWLVQDEFAMVKPSTQVIHNSIRHLLFVSTELFRQHALSLLDSIGSIQTLIFVDTIEQSLVESFIQRCQLLRVLILRNSGLKVMPRGIEGLKRLKYFDLTGNKRFKEIPNSICMLQSLETLILDGCTEVEELPRDIRNLSDLTMLSIITKQRFLQENGVGRLTSLRYLAIIGCPNLKYLPQGIIGLTSLTTLIIRDCNSLTSLPRSMKYLIALETLVIANCPELHLNRKVELQGGEGDFSATGLSLRRCWLASLPRLSDLPQWLVRKSARTLESLHIEDCQSFTSIPVWFPEELTSLKELEILNCKNFSSDIGIKPFTAFGKIKIEGCLNLKHQSLSTQTASSQILKSSIGERRNSQMEKGKGVSAENECESFGAAQEAIS